MKKTHLLALLAVGVFSWCFTGMEAKAQQSQGSNLNGKVALLDVNYVFKNHARFKGQMDELKNDADQADQQMKSASASLAKMAEKLQDYRAGTPDYKNMEEEIARSRADMAVKVQMQRKEFLMREAKIYNNVYREIETEVNTFCRQNGIIMVLRFMGDPIDPENPESILAGINKPVVWYDKSCDITPYILQRLGTTGKPAMMGRTDGKQTTNSFPR